MYLPSDAPPGVRARETKAYSRFVAFAAGSIALHALTLGASIPGAGPASVGTASASVLHAVLAPREAAVAEPSVSEPDKPQPEQPAADATAAAAATPADPVVAKAEPRSGAGGPDIPLPEKWYTAAEVDVRAEPTTNPVLHYPQELAGTGLTAKVRVRLFIDERGVVRKVELVDSGLQHGFDLAAQKAWNDVRFSPAEKGGVAVKSQKLLELDFTPDLALR